MTKIAGVLQLPTACFGINCHASDVAPVPIERLDQLFITQVPQFPVGVTDEHRCFARIQSKAQTNEILTMMGCFKSKRSRSVTPARDQKIPFLIECHGIHIEIMGALDSVFQSQRVAIEKFHHAVTT
jgi:hypothetical protein